MVLNSFGFLVMLPVVLLAYIVVMYLCRNNRYTNIISAVMLTSISYGFCLSYQPAGALVLLSVTAMTYFFALLVERFQDRLGTRRQIMVTAFTLIVLAPLAVMKYSAFIAALCTEALRGLHLGVKCDASVMTKIFVPLGISFFTLQAVGYMWDVYQQRISAEHNFLYYMLFVGFLPQIASGPISKADELLPQIKGRRPLVYADVTEGARLMLWGYFLKAMVADRLALFVNPVFDGYIWFSGSTCFVASVLYSLQIYGDFAGYSLIAIGVGRLFGYDLINNFQRPYLSQSITEFWRRWHISLTRWLRDYVYIPLGGNRKGRGRRSANIFATFLVSGLWHGANLTFLIWGAVHGGVMCLERAFGAGGSGLSRRGTALLRIAAVFLVVNFAWILFRMPTLTDAWDMIRRVATLAPGASLTVGKTDIFLMSAGVILLLVVEIIQEHMPGMSLLRNRRRAVRIASFVALLFMVLTMGVLDSSQFIYVQF